MLKRKAEKEEASILLPLSTQNSRRYAKPQDFYTILNDSGILSNLINVSTTKVEPSIPLEIEY